MNDNTVTKTETGVLSFGELCRAERLWHDTQDELDEAVYMAKADADMIVIPVRVPCPE